MRYPDFYFRPVVTVMSFRVFPQESGQLSQQVHYHTGVKVAYQVWTGNPKTDRAAFYLGVVFTDEKYPNQWMAINHHGQHWPSYGNIRLRAAEWCARQFYAEDSF